MGQLPKFLFVTEEKLTSKCKRISNRNSEREESMTGVIVEFQMAQWGCEKPENLYGVPKTTLKVKN